MMCCVPYSPMNLKSSRYPEIKFQTPLLENTTTFKVVTSRSNSCETVTNESIATIIVHADLWADSDANAVQDYFCNEGQSAIKVVTSKADLNYALYANGTLASSSSGNAVMEGI